MSGSGSGGRNDAGRGGAARKLAPVLDLARRELDGAAPDAVDSTARTRLLAALEAPPKRPRFSVRSRWGAAAVMAAAAAVVAFWLWPARPLSFVIDGHAVASSAGAPIGSDAKVSEVAFDDGTRVTFAAGASGRVADITPRGARVVMARGHAHFDVVHRPGAAWTVEAGRYVVRVTGTAFDVDWSPGGGELRVNLIRGSVVVEGTKSSVALGSGQTLDIDTVGSVHVRDTATSAELVPPYRSETVASETVSSESVASESVPSETARPAVAASEAAPVDSTGGVARSAASGPTDSARSGQTVASPNPGPSSALSPTASPSSVGMHPSATASTRPRATSVASWTERVKAGDYAGVVDAAALRGVDTVVDSGSLEELGALAEAARYDGKSDVARKALEGLRARFADSSAAHTATFLLGRMAEDNDGSSSKAIALYDEYLSTGGTFSAEALGRKMIAVNRASGAKAAEPIARHYLEKYPSGSYAGAAGRILGDH